MKKNTMIFNLLGVVLCGLATPAAADFCGQDYTNCCEWSAGDGKMTVGAEWLYWKVQQDGVTPGMIFENLASEVTPSVVATSPVRPKFKYDNGFRVNLGYELPCDCWGVNLSYTYMPSHAKTKAFNAASDLEGFSPLFLSNEIDNTFSTFAGKWNTSINNIDLDIGRTVSFGECLTIRPHIGFRANWFDQKFRGVATSVLDSTEFPLTTSLATSVKQKFQGYGVEGGLWADYKFGCGLSVVGHVGGSILYSKFNISNESVSVTIDEEGVATVQRIFGSSDSMYSGTPTVDYFVGLRYADNFCDMLVQAYVGWEQHVMFNTNRYFAPGNLSTQGLTLGLEVGF